MTDYDHEQEVIDWHLSELRKARRETAEEILKAGNNDNKYRVDYIELRKKVRNKCEEILAQNSEKDKAND